MESLGGAPVREDAAPSRVRAARLRTASRRRATPRRPSWKLRTKDTPVGMGSSLLHGFVTQGWSLRRNALREVGSSPLSGLLRTGNDVLQEAAAAGGKRVQAPCPCR